MAVPERFAQLPAQLAPLGDFTIDDLSTRAVDYYGLTAEVAAIRLPRPGLACAKEVFQGMVRGEEQRAGCSLKVVDELRPNSKLSLSYALICEHGRHRSSTQRRRAQDSDSDGAASAAEASTAQPSTHKRARVAASTTETSDAATQGVQNAACGTGRACGRGCCYLALAKFWGEHVLYVQVFERAHVDENGSDPHPLALSRDAQRIVRDGHARGLQPASIAKGACARS